MHPLAQLIRSRSQPIEPLPTGIEPVLPVLPGIRCVAFDIYGTLFISGSGDIGVAGATAREESMHGLLRSLAPSALPDDLVGRFLAGIRAEHERCRTIGIANPEVEIREIWAAFLESLDLPADPATVERLAAEYECAANPVWPMPGLEEILGLLGVLRLPLGIVSNAQFYTPLLFEAFLGAGPADLGFAPELSFYSYRLRRAKPGTYLFQALAEQLAELGIPPHEALYVGNDMRNDIAPAAAVGFRTALFAGDRRSLRLREDQPGLASPDAVITGLRQLSELLG